MAKMLFAGGGLDSLSIVSGAPSEGGSAGTDYDSTYCDSALALSGTITTRATFIGADGNPDNAVDGDRLFWHGEFRSNQSADGTIITLRDTAGFPWVRIATASSAAAIVVAANTNTGASPTWTNLGSAVAVNGLTRFAYDLVVDINSSGQHTAALYINGVLAFGPFNWTQASFNNVRSADQGSTGGTGCRHSQLMASVGYSTIGGKVKYSKASGAGATANWTGAHTDINEAALNDSTVLAAASAGLRVTHAYGDVTVPTNYVIRSVFQFARAKNDGVSPLNIKGVIRSGGTDYVAASNFPGIGIGFAPLGRRVDTDPATSASWTQSGFNNSEWGFDSAA